MLRLAGAGSRRRGDLAGRAALPRAARDSAACAKPRATPGRPAPRIACGFPIAVTRDVAAARESAEVLLARSAKLPAYQRVLERGGLSRPADAAIIGDEDAVARELARLAELGVTDLTAVPFDVAGDPGRPRAHAGVAGRVSRARVLASARASIFSSSSEAEFMQ